MDPSASVAYTSRRAPLPAVTPQDSGDCVRAEYGAVILPMPETLASRRDARERGLRRRLARCVRQAALHSTPAELLDLQRVVNAEAAGGLTLEQAQTLVSALLHDQEQRRAPIAA